MSRHHQIAMNLATFLGRTFGAEFEIPTDMSKSDLVSGLRRAGHRVEDTSDHTHDVMPGWKVVSDGSIDPAGWECVSPVLKGMGGLQEIAKFCSSLERMGLDIPFSNTSVGFHVHVGADDLDGDAVAKLICFHNHAESRGLLECLPTYRRNNRWCKPTKAEILDAAKRGPLTFREVRRMSSDRYVSLNMFGRCENYGTVEFRRHSGTVEGPKAVAWIVLHLHMVEAAQHLGWSGYGRDVRGLFHALGMYQTSDVSKFAADYLLARRDKFAGGEFRPPRMPNLQGFTDEVGVSSFRELGISQGCLAALSSGPEGEAWARAHGLHADAGARANLGRAVAGVRTGLVPLDRNLEASATAPGADASAEASLESWTLSASAGAHAGELQAGPFAVRLGGKFGGGFEGGVPVLHAGPFSGPCCVQ